MKFKVGDLITGTSEALAKFSDINMSDQAVLEVTEIDDSEYYCEVVSNEIDDSNVGETVTFYDDDERFFIHKKPEVSAKGETFKLEMKAEYFSGIDTNYTSSRLSSTRLLKAKGLI